MRISKKKRPEKPLIPHTKNIIALRLITFGIDEKTTI
jgi:hypothetical protein